jgi:ATP-dependent helicase HrpA
MALSRDAGVPVPRDAFREDLLPPHLRMNFLLVDDTGKVLARSRSLAELQAQHAGASQQDYAKQSRITSGARSWEFGDLPEQQQIRRPARAPGRLPGPGRRGRPLACAPSPRPAEAEASHERGAARLVRLVLARDMKSLRRDLP